MHGLDDSRAEMALRYLAETDESCAEAKADMERAEFKAKSMEAMVFSHETGSNDVRKAAAKIDARVQEAWDDYFAAVKGYAHMANKRETERIVLDTWRTIQANRRQG